VFLGFPISAKVSEFLETPPVRKGSTVNVQLACQDEGLCHLCHEVLTEYLGHNWNLCRGGAEPDLCIWDLPSEAEIPKEWEQMPSRYLFLVHRRDLRRFQECTGGRGAMFLLKPITRATLSAFLGMAISAHADRVSSVSRRIDRDEILQCLIQANLKLQEYDQKRTNFLARAMHDFRVPLTAVNGYCGLLLSGALGSLEENQKKVLIKMHQSNHRLSRMAEAMFQLSMGVQTKDRLLLRKEDIRGCLDQCIHEMTPHMESKRISVSVDLDPVMVPMLYFERTLIEQAVINFLDNACKFTPKGGRIDIRGYPVFWERRSKHNGIAPITERRRQDSREPNGCRIDITNSGRPIAAEHLEAIFEEYASYSGGQDRSGGGLGLAICKMIITQHEGRVWAENTEKGPQFSFILPVRGQSARVSAPALIPDVKEDSKESRL
jgi:signal transduction histidine kinase